MRPPELLFIAGAGCWALLAAGHLLLVDVLTLSLRTRVSRIVPQPGLLDVIGQNTIDFGRWGAARALRAVSGFSLWVSLSLGALAAVFFVLAAQPGIDLRPFAALGTVTSALFTAVAVRCFIPPPMVVGALSTTLFTAAWASSGLPA
jgi:hypothetical protein